MSQTNENNIVSQENQPTVQIEGGQFFVKTLTGKNLVISLNSDMTVSQLKDEIYAKEMLPQEQMRLIFSGKQLEDNRTLGSYNVTNNSTIHLVLRLKGGN